MKKITQIKALFIMAMMMVAPLSAQANGEENGYQGHVEVLDIGGVGNVRFIDPNTGYASSGGAPFSALYFIVTGMEPQVDGSILATMEHDFLTPKGGWLRSVDDVLMVPIEGSPGVFSLQVTYNITDGGANMEGYVGQSFQSRGFINTNTGIASVRYKGSIERRVRKDGTIVNP